VTATGVHLEHDWFPVGLSTNVSVGEGSWIYSSHAFRQFRSELDPGVVIGDHCGVYVGSYFNLGPRGSVEIGDYTTVVGAIFATNGRVTIGDHAFLAHEVVVAGDAWSTPGDDAPHEPIEIGPTAWVGARAVLLGGARIGEGAIVGAGVAVDFEVPAFATVAGNPARVVRRA